MSLKNLILILNCGSSSLKFAILDPLSGDEKLSGLAEAFHLEDARIKWKLKGEKGSANLGARAAHSEALSFLANNILTDELKNAIGAIGHRIVHGGEKFTESVLITNEVIKAIENSAKFAPLHNPAHLIGINEAFKIFPELKDRNVAVFDTAFHQSMPEKAYLYALPYELYRENGIRRYGFHGTSHYFISRQAALLLGKDAKNLNLISCHLGNGASICAIKQGKSVDTSMGLTPLEGLVMGTRSGDLDPAIIFYLHESLGLSVHEINQILTGKSGLLGLSEVSSDCRYSEDNYHSLDNAKRALDVFSYRLAKYIGSYMAALGEAVDAIIFTGGIGENSALVRQLTSDYLKAFGYQLDEHKNLVARFGKGGFISKDNTPALIVIPTNEELVIAQDTYRLTQ